MPHKVHWKQRSPDGALQIKPQLWTLQGMGAGRARKEGPEGPQNIHPSIPQNHKKARRDDRPCSKCVPEEHIQALSIFPVTVTQIFSLTCSLPVGWNLIA